QRQHVELTARTLGERRHQPTRHLDTEVALGGDLAAVDDDRPEPRGVRVGEDVRTSQRADRGAPVDVAADDRLALVVVVLEHRTSAVGGRGAPAAAPGALGVRPPEAGAAAVAGPG